MGTNTIFYQLFEQESSTYTYLIADSVTKEAALIDSVLETVDRDLKLVEELGLKLKYVLDTHVHADHVTGAGEIRKKTGAKTGVSADANVDCVDIPLEHEQVLFLGDTQIKALSTPGHTDSCMSFVFDGKVFTGDALLVRGTGRTDFQQGSADKLYDSVHQQLFTLSDQTQVYPGHDYRGQTASTVELERKFNPRLGQNITKNDFIKTMAELKLGHPKKIHEALPANLACGVVKNKCVISPVITDGIPEVSPNQVYANLGQVRIIDVRTPEEFNNELGHIVGAELLPLGSDLSQFLKNGDRSQEVVFVCRSGGRSGQATTESIKLNYQHTSNMLGGMIQWNELSLPVVRN